MPGQTYKRWVGQSPTFSSGGNWPLSTKDLPPGRILGILFRLKTDIVQAAGAVAITGSQLFRLFDLIRITDRVRVTGRGSMFLRWLMAGYTLQMPQDVLAAAATYSRFVDVYIPFVDQYAASPLDTAISSDLLKSEEAIQIGFGNVAALFGANTSLANTSVRTIFYFDSAKPEEVPSEFEINFFDANQQTILLPAKGGVSHLLVYSETTDSLTDANYTTWTMYAEGEAIAPVLQTGELLAEYDIFRAAGVTGLATATGVGGELLFDEPGVAAAAGQGLSAVNMIPLIIPPGQSAGYSLTHLPTADGSLRVDFAGAATAARFLQRTVKFGSPNRAQEILRQSGFPHATRANLSRKVIGFGRLNQRAASLLPFTYRNIDEDTRRQKGGR